MKKTKLVSVLVVFIIATAGCASNPALIQYIQDGNTEKSLNYIKSGEKIDVSDDYGLSPIHIAARKGNIRVLKALLDHGADINIVEKNFSMTPILFAAQGNHGDAIEFLIKHGANIDFNDRNGRTALKILSRLGNVKAVHALINAGAEIDKMQIISSTALLEAVSSKNIEVINILLESGANVSSRDDKGNTPVIVSSFKGDERIMKLLLAHGANISERNNKGYTPLIIAAYQGDKEIVQLSLIKGADINHLTKLGRSPLHLAAIGEHLEVMDILFKYNAKPILMDVTEDDLFGTAFSHGAYSLWIIKNLKDEMPEHYLNAAIDYFHKAEKEYALIESDLDWEISKQGFKSLASIIFASYSANELAHIDANASGTGVGYGFAPYRVYGTQNLDDVRNIFMEKKERSVALREKYEKIYECIKLTSKNDQQKCVTVKGRE